MELLKYNDLYNKNKSLIKIWLFIIVVIGCLILAFYNIDYENYYNNSGVVADNDILKIYVTEDDLDKIINNNKMKIKDKTFAYKIKSISDVLFNSIYYREVILNVDLKKNLNIKNNVIEFEISLDKKTIFEYIIYKIGG